MDRPSPEGGKERASPGARAWAWVPFFLLGGAAALIAVRTLADDRLGAVGVLALIAGAAGALFLRPGEADAEPAPLAATPVPLVDGESGVGNALQLEEMLVHEMSRCRRHGHPATLAVFELTIVGFKPGYKGEPPPPLGRHVARVLVDGVRESDFVLRLDDTHFAVLLTEAAIAGARPVIDRLRTQLAARPFARNADGTGIFARAWAGSAEWQLTLDSPAAFLGSALEDLEQTRPAYDAAQAFFRGTAPAT